MGLWVSHGGRERDWIARSFYTHTFDILLRVRMVGDLECDRYDTAACGSWDFVDFLFNPDLEAWDECRYCIFHWIYRCSILHCVLLSYACIMYLLLKQLNNILEYISTGHFQKPRHSRLTTNRLLSRIFL